MAGSNWTRERPAIDASPDGWANHGDAQAKFYGQPEELVDTTNSLRLFVSEQTEVDRSDPNLPPSPSFAPAVPDQSADAAASAPALGTPDNPSTRTAQDGASVTTPPRSDEPTRKIEPPTVIIPVPPQPRAFLPLPVRGTDRRSIAWRAGQGFGVIAVVVLVILGLGDLVSRLEDAFASSPEPQEAAAVATAAPATAAPATAAPATAAPAASPASTASPKPAPAAIAPAPASLAAAPVTPPPAANRPAEVKSLTASTPPREAAITPKPTLASQTAGTRNANPQNTANRTPATASATTQRAAATPTAGAAGRFVGTLRVGSQPAGAAVSINGKPIGVTPITLAQQRAGSLAVQITLEGFERWSAAVQVPAGRVTQVNATLRPAAP
jgi:hypothetical protein